MHETTAREYAARHPAVKCFHCGQLVEGIGTGEPYVLTVAGRKRPDDIPACPVGGHVTFPPMTYTAQPCGCKLGTVAAGALAGEITSRRHGGPPKQAMSDPTTVTRQRDKWSELLRRLYALRENPNYSDLAKRNSEFWIVIAIDQMFREEPVGGYCLSQAPSHQLHQRARQLAADLGVPYELMDGGLMDATPDTYTGEYPMPAIYKKPAAKPPAPAAAPPVDRTKRARRRVRMLED